MNETRPTPMTSLLAWQWNLYRSAHQDRANLAVHAAKAPLFIAGTATLVAAPLVGPWWAIGGALAAVAAVAAQGKTHARESAAPAPFRGPADVVLRILAEQWITFPRYVLTGAFLRAWRAAGAAEGLAAPSPSLR
jgi:hypothetical protein